jgi:hypothetical protein
MARMGLWLRRLSLRGMRVDGFGGRIMGWPPVSGFWRVLLTSLLILLRAGLMGLAWFVGFVRGQAPMLLALAIGPSVRARLRSAAPAA